MFRTGPCRHSPAMATATIVIATALALGITACSSVKVKTATTTTAAGSPSTAAAATSTTTGSTSVTSAPPTTVGATTLPATPDTRITPSGHDFSGTPVDPEPYATAGLGVFFQSPSGKFMCGIVAASPDVAGSGGAGCQGSTQPLPPRPSTCPKELDYGNGMQVDLAGAVSFVCTGGVVWGNGTGPGKVLPYGSTLTASGFVCTTATNGVSCMNKANGHGFTIAAASNTTY